MDVDSPVKLAQVPSIPSKSTALRQSSSDWSDDDDNAVDVRTPV